MARPATGPVVEAQLLAAPEIAQLKVPAGAVAALLPVMVAVKVMVPPKIGLAGEVVMAMLGVALATVRVTALEVTEE